MTKVPVWQFLAVVGVLIGMWFAASYELRHNAKLNESTARLCRTFSVFLPRLILVILLLGSIDYLTPFSLLLRRLIIFIASPVGLAWALGPSIRIATSNIDSLPEPRRTLARRGQRAGEVAHGLLGLAVIVAGLCFLPMAMLASTMSGNTTDVRFLLACGVPAGAPGQTGAYLNGAAYDGHVGVMRLLIDHGADVNRWGSMTGPSIRIYRTFFDTGGPPLAIAVLGKQPAAVALLLSRGAIVDARTRLGRTPLIIAAANGDIPCAQLLLDHGAAIDAPSNRGQTPLMFAVMHRRPLMVKYLIDCGAAINLPDSKQHTALWLAKHDRLNDIVAILQRADTARPSRKER